MTAKEEGPRARERDGEARVASWANSERVLDALFENGPAGFSIVDLEGRFVRVNPALCRLLRYSEKELLTMAFSDVTHPDDQGLGTAVLTRARGGDYHTSSFEKRYLRSDGELLWVLVNPTLLLDEEGRPAGYATLTLDVTERKQAEQALRQSEERHRTYVRAAPDGVFVIDGEGRYVDVNEAACTMTGHTREELLSMSIREMVEPARRGQAPARIAELAAAGRIHLETVLRRKDGTLVPVTLDAVKLSGDRMMAFCKDRTESVRAELERRTMEEQLERTQRLESLGVLAGGIAHDFNNLLVGVLGNADVALLDTPSTSPARAPLDDIVRAAQRAADLCQQMLAYAGQTSVAMADLDINLAAADMAGLLGSALSKRASLSYHLAADLPPILADAAQVRQVIMNLITNAAESNREGAVQIEITTGALHFDRATLAGSYLKEELAPGRYVYLEVKDDGEGMDPETQRRMFDPFFTTKTTGRGLGLAALLGIVRAHEGAIDVDSRPGRGTTVRVVFPARAPGARRADVDGSGSPESWRGWGTLLVVDDEPMVRTVTCKMLEAFGFEVIAAATGAQALVECKARVGELRCVLLDYSMPEMAGDEVLAELRELDAQVPVIVFSGFRDQSVEAPFAGLAVSAFLQKPFRMEELKTKLREALGC